MSQSWLAAVSLDRLDRISADISNISGLKVLELVPSPILVPRVPLYVNIRLIYKATVQEIGERDMGLQFYLNS